MAKDYQNMGKEIVAKLGGEMNITKLFHCATRLRFELKNKEKADLDAVKGIAGVYGCCGECRGRTGDHRK